MAQKTNAAASNVAAIFKLTIQKLVVPPPGTWPKQSLLAPGPTPITLTAVAGSVSVASAQPTPRSTQAVLACCHVKLPASATKQLPVVSQVIELVHVDAVADAEGVADSDAWLSAAGQRRTAHTASHAWVLNIWSAEGAAADKKQKGGLSVMCHSELVNGFVTHFRRVCFVLNTV